MYEHPNGYESVEAEAAALWTAAMSGLDWTLETIELSQKDLSKISKIGAELWRIKGASYVQLSRIIGDNPSALERSLLDCPQLYPSSSEQDYLN